MNYSANVASMYHKNIADFKVLNLKPFKISTKVGHFFSIRLNFNVLGVNFLVKLAQRALCPKPI